MNPVAVYMLHTLAYNTAQLGTGGLSPVQERSSHTEMARALWRCRRLHRCATHHAAAGQLKEGSKRQQNSLKRRQKAVQDNSLVIHKGRPVSRPGHWQRWTAASAGMALLRIQPPPIPDLQGRPETLSISPVLYLGLAQANSMHAYCMQ